MATDQLIARDAVIRQAAFDHAPAERRNAYAAAMAIGLAWSTQWR
jgi:hypothetical protein